MLYTKSLTFIDYIEAKLVYVYNYMYECPYVNMLFLVTIYETTRQRCLLSLFVASLIHVWMESFLSPRSVEGQLLLVLYNCLLCINT